MSELIPEGRFIVLYHIEEQIQNETGLYVKNKTKVLKSIIGELFCNFGIGKTFLTISQNLEAIKDKVCKFDCLFCIWTGWP